MEQSRSYFLPSLPLQKGPATFLPLLLPAISPFKESLSHHLFTSRPSLSFIHCLSFEMYPVLPDSPADLVPLPLCDGPKLKPFDFQGPQQIEFLEFLGEGLHSYVFKVKIMGTIYALKLVSTINI